MDEIETQFQEYINYLSTESKRRDSNRLRKDYSHALYVQGIMNLEKAKARFRTYAHLIQKWYDPSDKKALHAVKITKKATRKTFRLIQSQVEGLEKLSDFMDNEIFTLPD